jgi:hypothetical protein
MRKLAAICADVGVEILPVTRMPGPGQTTAKATLQAILRDRGEGHLIQLLRTFTETENENARIDTFALYAISDIMVAHPDWADSGLRWLEVMDRIDIAEIQRQAKVHRDVVPQREGVASALLRELSDAFANRNSPTPAPDGLLPVENDLLYGTKAIANFLEISLQKCRDLIVMNAIPTFTMPGSTTRCARKSALNAHWQKLEGAASRSKAA